MLPPTPLLHSLLVNIERKKCGWEGQSLKLCRRIFSSPCINYKTLIKMVLCNLKIPKGDFISGNFPNMHFPRRQLPKFQLRPSEGSEAAMGLSASGWARGPNKLQGAEQDRLSCKLGIYPGEVAAWEYNFGKVTLSKYFRFVQISIEFSKFSTFNPPLCIRTIPVKIK